MKKLSSLLLPLFLCGSSQAAVIDVHNHYIGDEYIAYLEANNLSLKEGFPLPEWSLKNDTDFMLEAGIYKSVLTLAPIHPYVDKSSAEFIRTLNQNMYKVKQDNPDKYLFCATLPLTNVEDAVKEAIYALDELHAGGISLGSNIDGQYLGDTDLEPLMKVLNDREAVVIIHPHKPYGLADKLFITTPLAMFEYPADTTRAVVNLVMHNTLVKYNKIKMVVPHGGSFLGLTIPRMKAIYPVVKERNMVGDIDIDANISRFYFDIAGVQSVAVIKGLLSYTDPSKILYGSDYPYFRKDVLINNMEKLRHELSSDKDLAAYEEAIFSKNAEKLFNL